MERGGDGLLEGEGEGCWRNKENNCWREGEEDCWKERRVAVGLKEWKVERMTAGGKGRRPV